MSSSSAIGLRGEGLVWPFGAMVCLLAAPWVQLSFSAGNGWLHNALRHHWLMPISCHFRECKALLVTSLTHVSGAIASVQTFTFLVFIIYLDFHMWTTDCIALLPMASRFLTSVVNLHSPISGTSTWEYERFSLLNVFSIYRNNTN